MITTLIPAYKVQYIAQLLSCLASQNYKKFRVIISDDSTNNEITAAIRQLQMKELSLPIGPTLDASAVDAVIAAVRQACAALSSQH